VCTFRATERTISKPKYVRRSIFVEAKRAPPQNQRESESMMKTDIKETKLQIWRETIGDCVKFEAKKDQPLWLLFSTSIDEK